MTVLERFQVEYQEYKSITRQRAYEQKRAVQDLSAFAGVEPLDCTPQHYKAWLRHLNERISPSTVKKQGMQVRAFFGWAFDAELYSANDLMAIRRADFPPQKKRLPRPYKAKEIKKLWAAIDKKFPLNSDEKWEKRFHRGTSGFRRIEAHANNLQMNAIARIAVECGLRRREIFDLALEDMHYDNAYIVVREGKGGKFREVPYTKRTKQAVREWIEFRTTLKPKHKQPWLALTRYGPGETYLKPMLFSRFQGCMHRLGPWQFHRLRHTCATSWLRAGMDIEVLSKLLGHAHLTETMGYVQLLRRDVQQQVERYEADFSEQIG